MKLTAKILLLYCFLMSAFVTISGFISARTISDYLFQLIFLPVTLYFVVRTVRMKNLDIDLTEKQPELIISIVLLVILLAICIN